MRYLGIDFGQKRIGVALSDVGGRIAFPKKVIFNRGNDYVAQQLRTIVEEESVEKIIVGLPLSLDGKETQESGLIRQFTEFFKVQISIPIEFENEMLTTHMVQKMGVTKEHTDEAAAALILQSHLDKYKGEKLNGK